MAKEKMLGLRSYQDIRTPEEIEERNQRLWERQRRARERAEYLAEIERDRRNEEG